MKKLQSILHYGLIFLCFPVVLLVYGELEDLGFIAFNRPLYITFLALVSAVIGLHWQRKWPVDWLLAVILPVSLAVGYFCLGLIGDTYGKEMGYFDLSHGFYIMTHQPLWLYAAATIPGLLTAFLGKFIKPRWLRFTCIGVLTLAIIPTLMLPLFRHYSPETVSRCFETYELYSCKGTDETVKEDGILAKHNSKRFRSVCTKDDITEEEVHERFGKPHALRGSGRICDVYFTKDNCLVYILYDYGCVINIREFPLE